jgi:hypothetical protein
VTCRSSDPCRPFLACSTYRHHSSPNRAMRSHPTGKPSDVLPLCFCRQPVVAAGCHAQRANVRLRLVPADAGHRLVIALWKPETVPRHYASLLAGQPAVRTAEPVRMSGGLHEATPLAHRDVCLAQREGRDLNPDCGLFVRLVSWLRLGEPMVTCPAGTTIIAEQSVQSRNKWGALLLA